MKKFALLFAICALASFPAAGLGQSAKQCPRERTISVSATGTASADADLAVVHVGYHVYGADAAAAYASASRTSNAIMKALTGFGVASDAIESSNQSLQQTQIYELNQYPQGSSERRDHAFQAVQSWTVRVAPSKAAGALNAAVNAGANDSGSIDWEMKDESALEAKAAAQAAANARAIAQQIAARMDVRITQLESLQENQPGRPVPLRLNAMMAGMARPEAQTPPLAINARKIRATVTVSAVFAIQ
ncbi:MAG: SIMPL domain-containing protein [Acidobacteriota bacterium]|jgi:hypothetical protein